MDTSKGGMYIALRAFRNIMLDQNKVTCLFHRIFVISFEIFRTSFVVSISGIHKIDSIRPGPSTRTADFFQRFLKKKNNLVKITGFFKKI